MKIKIIDVTDAVRANYFANQKFGLLWDTYVQSHPEAGIWHLSGWGNIIRKTYRHKSFYLMAFNADDTVAGILLLVHLNHFIFGSKLISIPFFDAGGLLSDNRAVEEALLNEAVCLGRKLKAERIELRHIRPLKSDADFIITRSHKVRLLLELPESSEILMNTFKSKLRSQIRKPLKEGLKAKIGSLELLDDFYKIFSVNMRDLGSPVHSKNLMKHVLEEFPEKSGIVVVYQQDKPLACSLFAGFKNILSNPWASSLREYSRFSPNMLIYWTMLEYACNNRYAYFDFGRSSPDEGTYKFKTQWGAKPVPLNWHYILLKDKPMDIEVSEKSKFEKAIHYWKKLPVSITKLAGPLIRKHIGL